MKIERLKKLQYYYTFFNIFSVIVLVQNLSIFFFPFLVKGLLERGNKLLTRINFTDLMAILLAIGTVVSVISTIGSPNPEAFKNSISVLPNYLYWIFILILFPAYAKNLDFLILFKAVFWGIIATIVYFYTVSDILGPLLIFKGLQQNTFSFILICFAPMGLYYTQQKYGFSRAVLFALMVVIAGAFSGSRSGSLITVLTCFLTLFSNKITISRLAVGSIVIFIVIPFLLKTSFVNNLIFSINERTYTLIYRGQESLLEDESYITRLAQIEKGIGLFKEHPITGIGINNFNTTNYNIRGDFEGSEKVMNMQNLDQLSAHNSYIGILSEGGLLMFVPFVALLLYLLGYLIINFKKIPDFQKPFFWGMVGMCIHLYFIMAIINVFAWLLLAFAATSVKYNK